MNDSMSSAEPSSGPGNGGNPALRRRLLLLFLVVVVVAGLLWFVFWVLLAPPSESTEDAYVAGDVVTVTARSGGTVIALHADDTGHVTAGAPLVDLDPDTADVGLAAAEADLAQAVRETRTSFARLESGSAAVAEAQARLAAADADLARRKAVAPSGAIPGEELFHAEDAVKVAQAALALAESREREVRNIVAGTTVETNPLVKAAIAAYRRAAITRGHMHIVAPVDGIVAKRRVQLGQRIEGGTPLMAIVPLGRVWVDANFRETQLRDIRIGQPATLHADMYGKDIVYHGRVVGLSAGSGDAFSILPPQNATGNWIKIVQRLPVRIALDPAELEENPLRIGLSVTVTVDTGDTSGERIASKAATPYRGTNVADERDPVVEARIRQIIADNR